MEVLTKEICREYQQRMKRLPESDGQDIGLRRKLRMELQKRCMLSEMAALNICKGMYFDDYISISERKHRERQLYEKEVKKWKSGKREKALQRI